MDHPDNQYDSLDDLLAVMAEGDLTQTQQQQLLDILRDDPEAQREFVRYTNLHAWLQWDQSQLPELESVPPIVVIDEKPESLVRRRKSFDSIHWQRHKIRFNAMTAVLTALAWVGFSYFLWSSTTPNGSQPNRGDSFQYVAEITGQYESRWVEGMSTMSNRTALLSGDRLDLAEGLVEITFDDGAVVVLEGPTEFLVDSSGAGTLNAGKLIARGHDGFSISTPSAIFIDLGTEFGASVDENGVAELHVFEGKVRAEMIDRTGQVLRAITLVEDEAVQIDARRTQFTSITPQPDIFPDARILFSGAIASVAPEQAATLSNITLVTAGGTASEAVAVTGVTIVEAVDPINSAWSTNTVAGHTWAAGVFSGQPLTDPYLTTLMERTISIDWVAIGGSDRDYVIVGAAAVPGAGPDSTDVTMTVSGLAADQYDVYLITVGRAFGSNAPMLALADINATATTAYSLKENDESQLSVKDVGGVRRDGAVLRVWAWKVGTTAGGVTSFDLHFNGTGDRDTEFVGAAYVPTAGPPNRIDGATETTFRAAEGGS